MKFLVTRMLTLVAGLLLSVQFAFATPDVPPAGQRVTDLAHALNAAEVEALASQLKALETQTRAQVGILIIPSLQNDSIEAFSQRVFDIWRLGHAGVDDGVLMVLAMHERRFRIHVGRGLEGAIPDVIATRIMRERMAPDFREKRYARGFSKGIEAVAEQIRTEGAQPRVAVQTLAESAPAATEASTGSDNGLLLSVLVGVFGVSGLIVIVMGLRRQAARQAELQAKAEKAAEEARERMVIARRAQFEAEEAAHQAAREAQARKMALSAGLRDNAVAPRSRELEDLDTLIARRAAIRASGVRTSSTSSSIRSTSSPSRTSAVRSAAPSRSSSSSSRGSSSRSASSSRSSSSRSNDDYVTPAAVSTWSPSPSPSYTDNSTTWAGGGSDGGGASMGF